MLLFNLLHRIVFREKYFFHTEEREYTCCISDSVEEQSCCKDWATDGCSQKYSIDVAVVIKRKPKNERLKCAKINRYATSKRKRAWRVRTHQWRMQPMLATLQSEMINSFKFGKWIQDQRHHIKLTLIFYQQLLKLNDQL